MVVNYNGGQRVLRVVQALLESGSALSEIVVVDNSSDDGSVGRIGELFPTVRLVALETNVGLSVARNIGLGLLRAPLALLLDHDVYVGALSIERMVAAYLKHQAAVVSADPAGSGAPHRADRRRVIAFSRHVVAAKCLL